MASLVVWAVFIVTTVVLGLVAHNFSVRTVRWVSAITAVILVCVITKYGINLWLQAHPKSPPSNLVNAFTGGVDALIKDLLRPLLFGYHASPPGPIGRGVAAFLLLTGYRELEAWTMHRQAPQLNSSALKDRQPAPSASVPAAASRGGDNSDANVRLHDQLAHEIKFRLAAIEVRAPAILPGGSRTGGLASIAEASGVGVAGMAGAIIRFAGSIWPSLRQLQLRVWVEPQAKPAGPGTATGPRETPGTKVTVYLEDPRNGATVATKTMLGADIDEAASMVAGYVAREVFTQDPSTPPWCYGRADGLDLSALLLARLERVETETAEVMQESRRAQIRTLWQWASTGRSAGVVRYELAQLLDLEGDHLAALRLHALSLDQYPRFYRGRYRLGMSLEMIAAPGLRFRRDENPRQQLDEILGILNRHPVTRGAKRGLKRNFLTRRDKCEENDLEQCDNDPTQCTLSQSLRLDLLTAALEVLRGVRVQLTLGHVVWATIRHRNERAVWLPYWVWLPGWGLRRRWAFHDGVRVAELLAATRIKLLALKAGDDRRDDELLAALKTRFKKNRRHGKRAIKIASAIARESEIIGWALDQDVTGKAGEAPPGAPAETPRRAARWPHWLRGAAGWLPTRRSRASWQAAYNAACLYAALAQQRRHAAAGQQEEAEEALEAAGEVLLEVTSEALLGVTDDALLEAAGEVLQEAEATLGEAEESDKAVAKAEEAVVRCLRSAVDNPRSEMERPSDWISRDPDLACLCGRERSPFQEFLNDQTRLDYPDQWSPRPRQAALRGVGG
jgi:hypothetical protein